MSKLKRHIARLEGWFILGVFGCLIGAILVPKVSNIASTFRETSELSSQIDTHSERMLAPPPVNRHQPYRSFILTQPDEIDLLTFQGSVQSSLIQVVKQNKARLIDLRAIDNDEAIGYLAAINFSLEVEGDLQAILDVLHGLSKLAEPLLITDLSLKPGRINGRADKNMRLSLAITLWTQKGAD